MSELVEEPVTDLNRTHLEPHTEFPSELSALSLVELQVLHSRLTRQLDHEYLVNPTGPHPVTQERSEQVLVELQAREVKVSSFGSSDQKLVGDLTASGREGAHPDPDVTAPPLPHH